MLLTYSVKDPGSKGFYLEIGTISPPGQCGDSYPLVVGLLAGPRYMLNQQNLGKEELLQRLQVALGKRAERVVYLIADRDVSMQEFVYVLDIVNAAAKKVHVVLVTPGNQNGMCLGLNPYNSLTNSSSRGPAP